MKVLMVFFLLTFVKAFNWKKNYDNSRYSPDWNDLDTRPLPQWYDEAKIGILLHWGVFSVPSFGSENFWNHWLEKNYNYTNFMKKNYPPNFTYKDLASMFTAEFFDPEEWASLFVKAGAKYVVLTSKHHDGYTLFPSKRSPNWSVFAVGPRRDLVGDLAASVRDVGLKFGVYYSLYEWYNPIYIKDKKNDFASQTFVDNKVLPDLKQLINDYNPSVLWVNGDLEAHDHYWRSREFLAWLYNDSPVADEIVTNDGWGIGCYGRHGDFFNYKDRHNPGRLLKHKWENAFSMDSESWGYRRNMKLSEVLSFNDMLYQVVSTVSCGGNVLINVGPTKEGTIDPIFKDRLLSLGAWLNINGEAIYKSSPWSHQKDSTNENVWYTCHIVGRSNLKPRRILLSAVYAIVLKWPKHSHGGDSMLGLTDIVGTLEGGHFKIQLVGNEDIAIQWEINDGLAWISMPDKAAVKSTNAWVLKIWGTPAESSKPNNKDTAVPSSPRRHPWHPGARQCPRKSCEPDNKDTAIPSCSRSNSGYSRSQPPSNSDVDKKRGVWTLWKKLGSLIFH